MEKKKDSKNSTRCAFCEGELMDTARVLHHNGKRYFVCSPHCELQVKMELQHLKEQGYD